MSSGRLTEKLSGYAEKAMREALGVDDPNAELRAATNPRFGDYQVNGILALAKALKANPRQLAERVAAALDTEGMCLAPEIAGPGFINLRLDPEWVAREVSATAFDPRLGVSPVDAPEAIVVDFSSPNVAKRMHVGHLRSTAIGDAIVRTLKFLGHRVIGDNHVGDWGTQFGIILWGWKHHRDEAHLERDPIGELERLYKLATALGKEDPAVADACRLELAKLQAGDPENHALWLRFVAISRAEAEAVYRRLEVEFDAWHGESYYNDALPGVVESLLASGLAVETQGAVGVFFPPGQGLPETPFLVRKSDGAFLYATTDIATIQHRAAEWQARRMIYVVDVRQSDHFKQLFATAALMGYRDISFEHVGFGMMLGADGRPFKTRDGGTVLLQALLDEAEERILPLVAEKWPEASEADQRKIASKVGTGAVKYADLAQNLGTDYKFDWDKLLAADGNTGPYLQYTLVRTLSVFREYEARVGKPFTEAGPIVLGTDEERELAFELVRLGDVITRVGESLRPHFLCEYAYNLARRFNAFYAKCPILKAEELLASRLTLTRATWQALEVALSCLNIPRVSRM